MAASTIVLANHYYSRARKSEAALAKEVGRFAAERAVRVSQQERTYLKALSERYGITPKEEDFLRDTVSFAARMNLEMNRSVPAEYSTAKTPWLPPPPKTLASRDLADAKQSPFSPESGKLELPSDATLYQYSISNPTSAPVPMPILHSGVRWDDANAMMETAGIRAIADETDRAIAIWRFVSENRYHARPVTEGSEEHDTVKFFSCYGYGFCDDAAQAVAGLAKLCGLEARIWALSGNVHVVSEVFAAGRWMLLDADFAVYFHKTGEPRTILGVEELGKDRTAFLNAVQRGKLPPFDKEYAGYFMDTPGNKPWPVQARSEHRIAAMLQPGERVVFSNFNWGQYFLGAYPHRVPRYFNGYFERTLTAAAFTVPDGLEIRRNGESFTIANHSRRDKRAEAIIEYPFPIVGGKIISPTSAKFEFEDRVEQRKFRFEAGREVSFDNAITQVAKQPTTSFTFYIVIPEGGMVKFDKPIRIISDFQFAELPLLRLKSGINEFKIHSSDPATLAGLRGEIFWK